MSIGQASKGSVGPQSAVPGMWSNTATRGSVGPPLAGQCDPTDSNFVVAARGTVGPTPNLPSPSNTRSVGPSKGGDRGCKNASITGGSKSQVSITLYAESDDEEVQFHDTWDTKRAHKLVAHSTVDNIQPSDSISQINLDGQSRTGDFEDFHTVVIEAKDLM